MTSPPLNQSPPTGAATVLPAVSPTATVLGPLTLAAPDPVDEPVRRAAVTNLVAGLIDSVAPAASVSIQPVPTASVRPVLVTAKSIVADVMTWMGLGALSPSLPIPATPMPQAIESLWLAVRDFQRRITGGPVVGTVTLSGEPLPGVLLNADGTRALVRTLTGPLLDRTTETTVIDTATGSQLNTPVALQGSPGRVLFSADGTRAVTTTSGYDAASGGSLTRIAVLDSVTGAQIGNVVTIAGALQQLSADGSRALFTSAGADPATGGVQTRTMTIDPATGTLIGSATVLPGQLTSLPLTSTADGSHTLIVTSPPAWEAAGTTHVAVVNPGTGAQIGSMITLAGNADGLVVTADGSRALLTTADVDGGARVTRVSVIDVATGSLTGAGFSLAGSAIGHGDPIVNADGDRALIVTGGTDSQTNTDITTMAVIDAVSGAQVGGTYTFPGMLAPVVSADRNRALVISHPVAPVSGPSTALHTIDLRTGAQIGTTATLAGTWDMTLYGMPGGSTPLIADDGRAVLTSSASGPAVTRVAVFDTLTGAQVGPTSTLPGEQFGSRMVSTDASRALIVTGVYDGATSVNTERLTVIDTRTGLPIGTATAVTGFLNGGVLFEPDTDRAVVTAISSNFNTTGTATTEVAVINTVTGNQVGHTVTLNPDQGLTVVSLNGTRALSSTGTQLAVIDTISGSQIGTTLSGGSSAVTADGTRAVVVSAVRFGLGPMVTQVRILDTA